jgi:hypothetical protein
MKILIAWVSDIYTRHGWLAALITLVAVAVAVTIICMAAGIDLGDAVRWLEAR